MKSYPSISREIRRGVPVFLFGKHDGSCMRVEWNRKNGFHKFGRRNGLLDDSNPILKRSPDLFLAKYGEDLGRIFTDERLAETTTCFFEFHGPSSFAGTHVEAEPQTVTMFDVSVYKKGFLEPKAFMKLFDGLDVQECLAQGNVTAELEEQVRAGTLPGMPFEGVVAKGALDRKSGLPLMFKIKSRAWIARLKDFCKGNEALFEKLL